MDLLNPREAERAVIGILVSGNTDKPALLRQLSRGDFCDSDLACIFNACATLDMQRKGIDYNGVDEQLTREFGKNRADHLMGIVLSASTEYRLQGWKLPESVRIVKEAAQRRKLRRIGEALARGAGDEQRNTSELIDAAREHLRKSACSSDGWVQATDACLETYEAAEHCTKPIRTGIHELDTILCGGLRRGELTILGARPAVGKSAALLYMALTAAREGAKVCFVSLEMSSQQIGARILAASSGTNPSLLQSGRELNDRVWADLAKGLERVGADGTERLSILVHGGLTIEELRSEIQSQADSAGCDLLVIDYLQLLGTKRKTSGDFERLGHVSRGLKALTLELGIPVIAAAQVRRQGNGGTLRAPSLDELRGSGDLEQDADNVILLHRPESGDDPTLKSRSYCGRHTGLFERAQARDLQLLTFDVAKQRQGMTARAWSAFQPAQMRFIDPGVIGA